LVDIARTATYALGDLSFREFRVAELGLANESSPDAFRRDCPRLYCGWL
jgi:hypothetical protein